MSLAVAKPAHAILSASGSKRWLACPPSAQLEQQFPNETSEYAKEGTFAHALGELRLSRAIANSLAPSTYKKKLAAMQKDPMYSASMGEYIEQYVTIVSERYLEAKDRCQDTLVMLEQRLDYSEWVPDGFGTGDVIIIADAIMEIIDLKYGKGVPVSAENNSQMRLYALGAIHQFGCLYDIKTVRMTIIQPRLDSVSSEEMSVDDLLNWAENEVRPKAALAIAGEGEFCAGDHCRFCRARFTCRVRAEANLELAKYDFQESFLLSDEEIAEVLTKAEELQKWAADIQTYALDQAENHGKKWPRFKLVEGRSNRKYTDEDAVAKVLLEAKYKEEQIYDKKVFGITAMEKNIGKKKFAELLADLVIKPAGKPVLVPESDKRPVISSAAAAAEDFKE
ncbi:DUF2800 domain-containing protein [bacterium]|nr:MAG: DUF2800 domain-containing protein [bacterium]